MSKPQTLYYCNKYITWAEPAIYKLELPHPDFRLTEHKYPSWTEPRIYVEVGNIPEELEEEAGDYEIEDGKIWESEGPLDEEVWCSSYNRAVEVMQTEIQRRIKSHLYKVTQLIEKIKKLENLQIPSDSELKNYCD